jgi:AcrR family transcriptional regulator
MFVERGVDAPLDHIAKAAGVGRATLYRNFPDRDSLALAVFERNVQGYEAMLADVSGPDGFERVLRVVMADVANFAAVGAAMTSKSARRDVFAVRDRVIASLLPLARMAQSLGHLREDITADDLSLIIAASAGGIAPLPPDRRQEAAERMYTLLLEGLKPLPEPPPAPRRGSSAPPG